MNEREAAMLRQRVARLEKLVEQLMQPKSTARLVMPETPPRLYRFTLNADLTTGVAMADILEMAGTDTGVDDNVRDPLGIFADLVNGDAGLCLLYLGNYYVLQAPCPV